MNIIFIALAIFAIFATLIKLVKYEAWWIRMFDFPQAQYTFIAVVAAIGYVSTVRINEWYEILLCIMLLGSIAYQLTIIIPYTLIFPKQVKQSRLDDTNFDNVISLVVVNVFQYNTEYEKCATIIKSCNADIIIAVETDNKWQEVFTSVLNEDYKHQCLKPIDNTYGMLLYSKLPMENTEIKFLIQEDVPSIHTWVRLRSGKRVRLYCVHPQPPSPTENEESTDRDAELLVVGKEAKKLNVPVVVAGDLNDVAWSASTKMFQRMSGLLDPRVGRGFYNTFHAKYPLFRWPLDHVFHSNHFTVVRLERLQQTGSDHFPMFVELYCDGNQTAFQEEPQPDKDDIEESEDKIDRARDDD